VPRQVPAQRIRLQKLEPWWAHPVSVQQVLDPGEVALKARPWQVAEMQHEMVEAPPWAVVVKPLASADPMAQLLLAAVVQRCH